MKTSITILKSIKPPLRWIPIQGDFTTQFLRSKSTDPNGPTYEDLTQSPDSVLYEAQRILGRCLPPTSPPEHETGLVVGYVQSGKTLSFETVISLARDNGYGIIIVLSGTKNNLREQSEERLTKDLGIDDGDDAWYHLSNPTDAQTTQMETKLAAWKKQPEKKRAVLITVLKQWERLEKLASLLSHLDIKEVPTLIIDDESDQASLNTKAAQIKSGQVNPDEKSTTYDRITELRSVVPHHSFLQYTATPQANLLLAQTDILNPSFAELVTPGPTYTGGKEFFKGGLSLTEVIPPGEVPSNNNVLTAPPKTLLSALRYFLLAAAHHAITREPRRDRNRSMMIHPSAWTQSHKQYKAWIDRALKPLMDSVEKQLPKNEAEVARRFQKEYESLKKSFPSIRPLNELLSAMVEEVFGDLNWVEVNGTPDAEKKIKWKQTRYWILVGGQKLDRGYTVEGLCVTYMPRPLGGSAAADTLQQRARFLGYKKGYLGLCRVFLQQDVLDAFTDYVEHEEFVRGALEASRGKPLSEWRRDFVLTAMLRPTRPSVIGLGARRVFVEKWMVPDVLQRDEAAAENNRLLLAAVDKAWSKRYGPVLNASQLPQFAGKATPPHSVIDSVPLRSVLEDFLLKIQIKDPKDAEDHSAVLIALGAILSENQSTTVQVFLMNNLDAGYRTRDAGRGFPATHRFAPINNYFSQSANSLNDRSFVSDTRITLQLRRFDLGTHTRDSSKADIKSVTWFALHVPASLTTSLIVEERA
ncbi:MAG TPA: Z1 domain-containing protein [Terracidiphilus sp.]|jgi:hypothetical protein|nr:Z1 domain-containing protein [Terracidiphilus sp.]